MAALLRDFWRDDAGLILSAELVIILTIAVIGMVVGLVNLQHAMLNEFADLSLAFQSLNQSYATPSFRGCWKYWGRTSWTAGSAFIDVFDGCVGSGPVGCDINGSANYLVPNSGVIVPPAPAATTTTVDTNVSVQPALQDTTLQPPCSTCN